MTTVDAVLRGLAAWKIGGARASLPRTSLDAESWDDLQRAVTEQRMWGLLAAAIAAGDLPVRDKQGERSESRHRRAMETSLELEAFAIRAIELLWSHDVPVRLLKGVAVAHLDEPDPSLRCFNDVDVLVPPERFSHAVEVLTTAGYRRDLPERRPGFDQRFVKEATMTGPGGRELDVHRTIALGAFGLAVDLRELWGGTAPVPLAGVEYPALDADRRLLHACYAAILGDPTPRLVLLRDIALLLTGGRIDEARVRSMAAGWRGEAVLAWGVTVAAATLRADGWPLLDWARSYEPSRWSERALRAYRSGGGTNTTALLSGVMGLGSFADRAAYLRGLVLPAPRYRRARRAAGRPAERATGLRELLPRPGRMRS